VKNIKLKSSKLCVFQHDYREIEGTLFDIKVKQEVIVAPLRDYIEKWLESTLIKITEENQVEAVGTSE
jgi:hypothetical protein